MGWFFRFLHSDHRLGMRIIKSGIAVTLCIAISNLLSLHNPLFAAVATVMSMGKSIDMSVRSGKNKMIGVVIGAALGGCLAALSPANAGLCGIGIIAVLYLCHLFRLDSAQALSCFTFLAVLFGAVPGNTWDYALRCGVNALLGIGVALAVNLVVMPPNYVEEIKRSFAVLREKTSAAIEDAAARRRIDVEAVNTAIENVSRNIRLYVSELKPFRGDDDEIFRISCHISIYRLILDELKAVEVMELTENPKPGAEIETVYSYHMKRIRQFEKSIQSGLKSRAEGKKEAEEKS